MKRIKDYLPAIIVALLILILTAMPGGTIASAGLNKESYHVNGHFVIYFLLCITLFKALKNIRKACAVGIVYGILMEMLQKLVPGRAFQLLDITVNSFGSLLAFLVLWKRQLILPKKLLNWLEE